MQLLLIINDIVPLIKYHDRVVEIDADAIPDLRVEYGSIREADDVTAFDEISSAVVRTQVVGGSKSDCFFYVVIEELLDG